jgi:hypothetical protein
VDSLAGGAEKIDIGGSAWAFPVEVTLLKVRFSYSRCVTLRLLFTVILQLLLLVKFMTIMLTVTLTVEGYALTVRQTNRLTVTM